MSCVETFDYEVAVIGAGPGGYETAIKSAQMWKRTCIVESAYFGGTCLNVGCIPTKALIQTAELYSKIKESAKFAIEGVDADKLSVDMKKLQELPGIVGYIVQPEDSLWTIAKKFHTTVGNIITTNELADDQVKEGQRLLLVKEIVQG